MILIFLGSLRATSAVLLSIPISALTTFVILSLMGSTINTMILGGLALAFSRVIDNSVISLENIYRHLEMGSSPAVAAEQTEAAVRLVNDMLATTGARPRLDRHDGEPWHLHFHGAEDSLVTGWAAGCATGLAVVLGGESRGRLGVCSAPSCDRVFVDTSRNATRRLSSLVAAAIGTRTMSVPRSATIWPNAPSATARIACAPKRVASTRSNAVGVPPR